VPESGMVFDVAGASAFIARDALLAPVAVGSNVTLTVQAAPAARPAPPIGQVLVLANDPGSVPLIAMLVILSGAVPVLLTVTVLAVLIVLINRLPKVRDDGETAITGEVPVPESGMVVDVAGASAFIARDALLAPVAVGLNVTLIVQDAPAASAAGQVVVLENWPGFAPPRLMLLMVIEAIPMLVTVTDWVPLAVLTN
jgi:hypothetical protein